MASAECVDDWSGDAYPFCEVVGEVEPRNSLRSKTLGFLRSGTGFLRRNAHDFYCVV